MTPENKQQNHVLAERLIAEQNFIAACVGGFVAMIIAAVGYGIVTLMWGFSYGFAMAGVGIIIGLSMQFLGRGIDMRFSVAASLFTIAGCFLGNVFRHVLGAAQSGSMSVMDVFRGDLFLESVEPAAALFSLIDIVYWFIAIIAAAFLARRPLSRTERLALGTFALRH